MEGVVRLSSTISPRNAKDLQALSDKIGNEKVSLQLLFDADANFAISNTLNQKGMYLELYIQEAKNWYSIRTHIKLAK